MIGAVALLDANVLYAAPLRDLLIQLAFDGTYRAHWSADIDDEWTRNLVTARPELASQIRLTQALMRRAIPAALVTGYARYVPGLVLPDPDDRHVLAAAITAEADVIVTYNLKDFPESALKPYGIEAVHPDAFLMSMASVAPLLLLAGVRTCLARLSRPTLSPDGYQKTFLRLGLTETVGFLAAHIKHWQR
jgi:predicted nucleic acid-binding protein